MLSFHVGREGILPVADVSINHAYNRKDSLAARSNYTSGSRSRDVLQDGSRKPGAALRMKVPIRRALMRLHKCISLPECM